MVQGNITNRAIRRTGKREAQISIMHRVTILSQKVVFCTGCYVALDSMSYEIVCHTG